MVQLSFRTRLLGVGRVKFPFIHSFIQWRAGLARKQQEKYKTINHQLKSESKSKPKSRANRDYM